MAESDLNTGDETIVEHLREVGRDTPANMAAEYDYHRQYVYQRCRRMTDAGILVNHGNGVYGLAEDGE